MTMLVPILAGIGALCMSNPVRRKSRRKAKSRRRAKRRNPYGDHRDYRKIDIFVGGNYVASTTWAKNLKEAIRHYKGKVATTSAEKGLHIADRSGAHGKVTAHYADKNPAKRRKGKRKGHRTSPGAAASRLAWWRWHSNPGGMRDLEEHEMTRGAVHVSISTWRNKNATAFIAVTARGPGGVKGWEAKSQGPSSGGYSKPQQAMERVYHEITGQWDRSSQGSSMLNAIATEAAKKVSGPESNPRRRKSRRKSRR